MPSISFLCPDCNGMTYFSAKLRDAVGGKPEGFCITCCGIGTKHMNEDYPSDSDERVRILELYRKWRENIRPKMEMNNE